MNIYFVIQSALFLNSEYRSEKADFDVEGDHNSGKWSKRLHF